MSLSSDYDIKSVEASIEKALEVNQIILVQLEILKEFIKTVPSESPLRPMEIFEDIASNVKKNGKLLEKTRKEISLKIEESSS